MKVRLAVLIIGVLLGLVCRWGLSRSVGGRSSQSVATKNKLDTNLINDQLANSSTPFDSEEDSYVDPLVPPANVFGVASPVDLPTTSDSKSLLPSFLPKLKGEYPIGDRAFFEPHGEQVCASGCAVSRHPTEELTKTGYLQLLEQYLREPTNEDSEALEALLFYGRQTSAMIVNHGLGLLDRERAALLQDELKRTHAKIRIRVTDENGVVRSSLPQTSIPLDRRHVFLMDVNKVQPLVTSGTVKRVGLYHLWTRL